MKVRYNGKKAKMTIGFPIGAGRKKQTFCSWTPGEVVELSEDDGAKLIETDKSGLWERAEPSRGAEPVVEPAEAPVEVQVRDDAAPRRRGRPRKVV